MIRDSIDYRPRPGAPALLLKLKDRCIRLQHLRNVF